jgi:hypothetical protein
VHAAVHAGGEHAAVEAVAAKRAGIEAGGGAGLDDAGDCAGVDRRLAESGGGEGTSVELAAGGWSPNSRAVEFEVAPRT